MSEYHKLSAAEIQEFISQLTDPFTERTFAADKAEINVKADDSGVEVTLERPYPAKFAEKVLSAQFTEALAEKLGKTSSDINLSVTVESNIVAHSQQHAVKGIPGIGNIIAIASGKGGVGKSTLSANLALALSEQGAKVGVLDADIYGPSQPGIFNVSGKPEMIDDKMQPLENHGIQVMSIGLMVEQETPMIWRGPMVTQALEQMLRHTNWKDLDYLILDLPPGTGDVQLTLAQKVPLAGATIVTTPQDLALYDVRKAIKMFQKVEVPIFGVVENMSSHICSSCNHEEFIFGSHGGENLCKEYDLSLLGQIPLDIRIRKSTDAGKPTVINVKDSSKDSVDSRELEIADRYHETALKMVCKLAGRKKDYRSLFPKIEISNT